MIRNTKRNLFILFTFALFTLLFTPLALFAADTSATAPAPASPGPFTALIPLAVPVIIALLKNVMPKIPGVWLPILAPLLGAGADIVMHFAGVSTLGPLWGAVLGSAGVGLRELQDQVKQAVLPAPAPPTST